MSWATYLAKVLILIRGDSVAASFHVSAAIFHQPSSLGLQSIFVCSFIVSIVHSRYVLIVAGCCRYRFLFHVNCFKNWEFGKRVKVYRFTFAFILFAGSPFNFTFGVLVDSKLYLIILSSS